MYQSDFPNQDLSYALPNGCFCVASTASSRTGACPILFMVPLAQGPCAVNKRRICVSLILPEKFLKNAFSLLIIFLSILIDSLYEEDVPVIPTSTPPTGRHRRNRDRTYEVTTTTESFHRTIVPPADGATIGQRDKSGSTGGGYAAPY